MKTLRPDLVRYVHNGRVHHPLVIGLVTSDNSRINLIYKEKKSLVRRQEPVVTGKNTSSCTRGLTV
jgi:hypothetical protein